MYLEKRKIPEGYCLNGEVIEHSYNVRRGSDGYILAVVLISDGTITVSKTNACMNNIFAVTELLQYLLATLGGFEGPLFDKTYRNFKSLEITGEPQNGGGTKFDWSAEFNKE